MSGQMVGNVLAQRNVDISHSANFQGEIHASGIAVENGADFNGTVELSRGSHKKAAAKMSKSEPQ
ncbi:MAG: polymer-forming cytoskeletal protein [Desulfobacterales bacterium]|nr:polymer-forming cytoskeletal protein [Desulfobacterales bacterium]